MNIKLKIISVLFIFIFSLSGCAKNIEVPVNDKPTNTEREIQVKEINKEEIFNSKLKNEIDYLILKNISKYNGKIGVSFLDLDSDIYTGYNDNELFVAGSTFKVPLAMFICDMLYNGTLSFDEVLYYNNSYYEEGMGVMLYMDKSRGFTIEELMTYMITESDNIATNMLLSKVGFYNAMVSFGNMIDSDVNTTENIFTPNQLLLFLKKLYLNESNNPYYDVLLNLMKNTTTHDRLDKYLPYEKVAHKIGNYAVAVNDIGIFLLDKPYILTVYTEGMVGEANEFISNLSKDIYELYDNFIKENGEERVISKALKLISVKTKN